MSQPALTRGHRILIGAVFTLCATVVSPRDLFSQQPLEGEGLALDLLERLEYTRAGANSVTASMSLVQFEPKYCLPPDPPSRQREEQFLKSRLATVAEYERRYNSLRAELLTLISSNGGARRAVDAKFDGNPMSDGDWASWRQAFERAKKAVGDKQKELSKIPIEACRPPQQQQQPAADPPPTGPGIDLPVPKVRPVAWPKFETPFCSESDKQKVIDQFRAIAWDYYMNYQDAREYHDAIKEALDRGRGNASVLRNMLPGARASLDTHAKALDDFNKELDRVRALPVIDCNPQQQPAPDPVPPLIFDPFVFPAIPPQFCSQDAKDETVRQLGVARDIARRNSDKAGARSTELRNRITRGDSSSAVRAALREANDRASQWLQQSNALNVDMQRAAAMPVVACASQGEPIGLGQPAFGNRHTVKVGFTYNLASFSRFQGFVGDQEGIATATSDETINQVGVHGELTKGNWFYGGGIRLGKHTFAQTFQPGDGRPSAGSGTVNGYFGDFYCGRRVRIGSNASLGLYAGPVLTHNRGRMLWNYGVDEIDDVRNHTSLKMGLGTYIDVSPGSRAYGRVGIGHVSANSDADDHTYYYLGAGYQLNSGNVRYARPGNAPQSQYQAAIRARTDSMRAAAWRAQP